MSERKEGAGVSGEPAPGRRGSRSRLKIAFVVVGGMLVVAALLAVLGHKRLATWYVVREFRAQGVLIEPETIEVTVGMVRLRDTRFTLAGVSSVVGLVELIEVGIDGLKPAHVQLRGVGLEVQGAPNAVAIEFDQWERAHVRASSLPTKADAVSLHWRERRQAVPWLSMHNAAIGPDSAGGRLRVSQVTVSGVTLHQISARWKSNQPEAVIAIGSDDPSAAPWRLEVMRHPPFAAKISWKQGPLHDLFSPFGFNIPLRGVSVEGSAEVRWSLAPGPTLGSIHLVLVGYVPPHPVELNGIVFGDRTVIDSKLTLFEDNSKVALTEVKVLAGAFQLEGSGQVQRVESHGLIGLKLNGSIPCSALARSAAVGRLGRLMGGLIGGIAQGALAGAITVGVSVDADTRDLGAAKVEDRIGGGCTLRLL
jgi:hypothetical protein